MNLEEILEAVKSVESRISKYEDNANASSTKLIELEKSIQDSI